MDITGNSIYSYYGGGQTSLPTDPTFNTVTVTDIDVFLVNIIVVIDRSAINVVVVLL